MAVPDSPSCDAQRLLRLVRSGDAIAMEEITRCYGSHLLAVGKRQCGGLAEDAVQDALVSATEHLGDFREDGNLQGWLSRMVTNACRRMQRGGKADASRHEEFVEGSVADRSSSNARTPDSLVAIRDLGNELVAALQTLKPQDRAIVLLAEVNGWKGPEIAKSLDLSPTQVRTRLSRSRAHLREELAKVWSDWSPAAPQTP